MARGDRAVAGGLGRSVRTGILLWLLVVGAVSTLGWLAIARAGEAASLLGSEPPPRAMTAPAATSAPATVTPSSVAASAPPTTPAATRTGNPSTPARPPAGGAPPPATSGETSGPAKGVPGSTTTRGGSIGASCSGSALALSWVTPNQGWSNTRKFEDDAIEVKFRSGQDEVEVKVRCSDGRPTFEID